MLGISLPYLVAFMINFLLLLGLLTLALYKPMTKTLDERAAKIKESLEKAEQIQKESVRAEESVRSQIEAGRKEGQALIAQAAQTAERVKEETKAEARKEAEALIVKAQAQIESDRDESFNKLRREFADLAILAAEKVIEQSLDKKAHEKLIEKVLEEGLASKKSQLN
jgi:F-type H+-transporting ATPase subunit b